MSLGPGPLPRRLREGDVGLRAGARGRPREGGGGDGGFRAAGGGSTGGAGAAHGARFFLARLFLARLFSTNLSSPAFFERSQGSALRSEVNSELNFSPNFEGLVLGCIDADFCK